MNGLSGRYVALAIQGNLNPAMELLRGAEANASPATSELEARFRVRFVDRTEPLSPASGSRLIDAIVSVYRTYWTDALFAPLHTGAEDGGPDTALAEALRPYGWPRTSDTAADDVYSVLERAVEAEGFHALLGPAPPLQDLLLWRTQKERQFEVKLTDQKRRVNVMFLSGFYSRGWKDWASLGLANTAGWVENGVLYCVDGAYEPGTESFEVSYLKHESRHLADLERFPELPAADLEYRAKLTELAFASQTLRSILDDFTAKSAPNPASAHAEANYRVTHDLYLEMYGQIFPGGHGAWMTLNTTKVNRAARRLLNRDTVRLGADFPQAMPATVQPHIDDFPPMQEPQSTAQLAEIAVRDLASRLDLSPELITVIDITPVIWPDSSLGCPQEGMVNAKMETNGFIVTLEANGRSYPYHTDTGQQIVSCDRPQLPVFPVTPGEIDDGQPWVPVDQHNTDGLMKSKDMKQKKPVS